MERVTRILVDREASRAGHVASSLVLGGRRVAELRFDIIVPCLRIPGKSGFDHLRQLRATGNRTYLYWMLTARSSLDDRVPGRDSDTDYYLVNAMKVISQLETQSESHCQWSPAHRSNPLERPRESLQRGICIVNCS